MEPPFGEGRVKVGLSDAGGVVDGGGVLLGGDVGMGLAGAVVSVATNAGEFARGCDTADIRGVLGFGTDATTGEG